MTRFVALLAAAVTLAAIVSVLSASAGPPGAWTRLTEPTGRNIDEVGLARTPDGVLHVFWRREANPGTDAVLHRAVSPQGKAGAVGAVLEGLSAAGNPDAVVTGDQKLRVFFMGLGGASEGGVVSATAPLSGVGWTLDGPRVSSSKSAVGPVGAAVAAAGTPLFSYAMTGRLGFHAGLDPATPDQELQPAKGCCDYVPDIATDAGNGQSVLAWFSLVDGRQGTWARTVLPSVGAPLLAPGSATGGKAIVRDQRTAVAARIGQPGVFVAYCSGYPTCKRALLWRVGSPRALAAGGSPDVEDVNVAAGPEGRLWVMWHDGQSSKTLFIRRTNKAATRFGPVVRVKPPGGTTSVWKLKGEGSLGALDLFASVTTGKALATWHTQVRPPLSLSAKRTKNTVTFRVTDAGEPVAAATVKVGGKTLRTSAAGTATTSLAGAAQATASRPGYASASVRIGA